MLLNTFNRTLHNSERQQWCHPAVFSGRIDFETPFGAAGPEIYLGDEFAQRCGRKWPVGQLSRGSHGFNGVQCFPEGLEILDELRSVGFGDPEVLSDGFRLGASCPFLDDIRRQRTWAADAQTIPFVHLGLDPLESGGDLARQLTGGPDGADVLLVRDHLEAGKVGSGLAFAYIAIGGNDEENGFDMARHWVTGNQQVSLPRG